MKNLLGQEKSPYLLQHKDNPIAWMPWGEDAFARARAENKPIFLSVGYSTCHWCHVMAHESFEDAEVARVLNEHFVSIKLDREERPDVDQVYMSALQAISGGGGWPMSVWLTADGKPFFAGTYFPKQRFLQLLERIQEMWASEPAQFTNDAERLIGAVQGMEDDLEERSASHTDQQELLKAYISHFHHHFDERNGGFGGAPKFPQTMNLMVMMRQDFKTGLRQAEAMVNTTLLKMARGGVYDQLAGGFHRYSVDEQWLVPHFEKMLYDQALLGVTLVEAYQLYGEKELARAARETMDYVLREMTHAQGGFYSAQDADSLDPNNGHSEEGFFCTYTYDELRAALSGEELELVTKAYGVSEPGNFEGRNILHLQEEYGGEIKQNPLIASAFEKLKAVRVAKPPPHLDDKIIAAWNGWMIWALARAGRCLSETKYLKAARKALVFIADSLCENGELRRFWRDGEARGRGQAEDYASVIHACLEVYQCDFDQRWAQLATQLQQTMDTQFWDEESGLYFSNDGRDPLLPMRLHDQYDGVHPSSNSMAAYNLARIYLLNGDSAFKERYERIQQTLFTRLGHYPSGLAFLALALDFQLNEAKVAVLNGSGWVHEYYEDSSKKFEPHRLWARADSGWPVTAGKTGPKSCVYICSEGKCLAPAESRDSILN